MSTSIPISGLNTLDIISSSDYIPIVKESTITTFRTPVLNLINLTLSASISTSFSDVSISSSYAKSASWSDKSGVSINSYNLNYPNTSTASYSIFSISASFSNVSNTTNSASWSSSSLNSISASFSNVSNTTNSASWSSSSLNSISASFSNVSTSSSYSLSSSFSSISTSSSYANTADVIKYPNSYILAQDASITSMISMSVKLSPGTWQLILDSRFNVTDIGINYNLTNTHSASVDINVVNNSVALHTIGGSGYGRIIYGSVIGATTFDIGSTLTSILYISPPKIQHISSFGSVFGGAIATLNKII